DTQRCDGIAGPTAVRTASLRLPRLQRPVRALCPRRQADHHRSFDDGRLHSGEGGGNRTRGYITYPKKNCLAGFATIERALRQCDYAPGGSFLLSLRNYGSAPRLSPPGISDLKPTTFRCEAGRPAADATDQF